MKELFLKRYWEEENLMFYFPVIDNIIHRQIEESPTNVIFRDQSDHPVDQPTHRPFVESEFELTEYDIISEEDFNAKWKK